jgi:hypothetical protein
MKNLVSAAVVALSLVAGGSAHAVQFVTNGGFETTTGGSPTGYGQLGYNVTATGWSTSGYNFLFNDSNVSTGVTGSFGGLSLWTSSNGGLDAIPASPAGGNFVAADGAFQVGAITQTLNGLTVGAQYAVSFYWGAAQQSGFDGATTDKWTVSLGSESKDTNVISLASHSFSGWEKETLTFTATSSSEVLSFLATGTPAGVPPFALLDGVSVTGVPELSTWGMMLAGFAGLGVAARLRRRRAVAA